MPHALINQAQDHKLLPISLQNQSLNANNKLAKLQGNNKRNQEDKRIGVKWRPREDKKITKSIFFHSFCAYTKKITFTLGACLFLLVNILFTPSEGPKGLVNWL